jgi:succinate dehydrogenase / fumarate reductase cytochrome b subunit
MMEKTVGIRAGGYNLLVRRWVFPFNRTIGTWAFVLNRWSGVLLAIYLYVHLGILTSIAVSPDAYNQFLMIARSPLGLAFDVGLILLVVYHGLNGLRIIYATLAGKIERHEFQFWLAVTLTLLITVYSAVLIFSYE